MDLCVLLRVNCREAVSEDWLWAIGDHLARDDHRLEQVPALEVLRNG